MISNSVLLPKLLFLNGRKFYISTIYMWKKKKNKERSKWVYSFKLFLSFIYKKIDKKINAIILKWKDGIEMGKKSEERKKEKRQRYTWTKEYASAYFYGVLRAKLWYNKIAEQVTFTAKYKFRQMQKVWKTKQTNFFFISSGILPALESKRKRNGCLRVKRNQHC